MTAHGGLQPLQVGVFDACSCPHCSFPMSMIFGAALEKQGLAMIRITCFSCLHTEYLGNHKINPGGKNARPNEN